MLARSNSVVAIVADSKATPSSHEVDEHVHTSQRSPWLRAMMIGALDGLLSVAAVMLGVGGGTGDLNSMRLAGIAAWIAGALSMFLGEYASVAAQRDSEATDIEKERQQQQTPEQRAHEQEELAQIYVNRGLSLQTAREVAAQLSAKDAVRAHARDELGIDVDDMSNPLQAGLVDMLAFTAGAAVPLVVGAFIPDNLTRLLCVGGASVLACAAFGLVAAFLSGVRVVVGTFRVCAVGTITLVATWGVGYGFSQVPGLA
ncbi:hypothetical protein CEUSTIGMA_g4375.t1 [Chlamydomonas eustigma]|uniref:Uncharacterized protein n=1 Tax=Chlamydomonas eustigma TaxID=1157962 RepID=A0A250X1I3_9CHLO|nr:hypothetical protein CEUSTIGMA_g4375.t1 [Chlamydomonas eustigma]|eukprot:GAX76928.1 hypothetical protein CEUSTIGMA_g4375.t1 [Chlamydomonas eustigma]